MVKNYLDQFQHILLFIICGAFVSCQTSVDEEMIIGQWKAVEVMEEDQKLNIEDPSVIELIFHSNEFYEYSSTLNYKEAGSFELDLPYLITIDTLNKASTKKAVKINKLTTDSLILLMEENEKKRILKMVRVVN